MTTHQKILEIESELNAVFSCKEYTKLSEYIEQNPNATHKTRARVILRLRTLAPAYQVTQ